MQYIDLSVDITNQTPVWPGDSPFKITQISSVAHDGCSMHEVSGTTHAGTHVDAPSHMLEGGKTLDQYPVEHFTGRGRLVDARSGGITLEAVQAADIHKDDIVLFWTEMSKAYAEPAYFETYPAIPAEVAEYLVKQKVRMVGVDTASVDHEEFIAHKILLKNDVLIIENLTNLATLVGKDFSVYALPIKLHVDGAPARVISVVA